MDRRCPWEGSTCPRSRRVLRKLRRGRHVAVNHQSNACACTNAWPPQCHGYSLSVAQQAGATQQRTAQEAGGSGSRAAYGTPRKYETPSELAPRSWPPVTLTDAIARWSDLYYSTV